KRSSRRSTAAASKRRRARDANESGRDPIGSRPLCYQADYSRAKTLLAAGRGVGIIVNLLHRRAVLRVLRLLLRSEVPPLRRGRPLEPRVLLVKPVRFVLGFYHRLHVDL